MVEERNRTAIVRQRRPIGRPWLAGLVTLLLVSVAMVPLSPAPTSARPTNAGLRAFGLSVSTVTFSESGLAATTSWSVDLGGSTASSLAPLPVAFVVSTGLYAFTIPGVPGYTATPSSGTVNATGLTESVAIQFSVLKASYPVAFSETGLPTGTVWSVTLNGTSVSANAPSAVRFNATNGSYPFTVGPISGYESSPSSGTATVRGAALSVAVAFGPAIQHVVEIVLENEPSTSVLSPAPYQTYLASTYAQATHYYGACHYSYPDYSAMTSGRYFACGTASIAIQNVSNIADLLEAANLSWMGYFESMGSPCQFASNGTYAAYHDPFILYRDIRLNNARCDAHVVNSASFNASVANGTLPNFSYYVPNVKDDCYQTNETFCDTWLRGFLSPILNSTNPAVRDLVATTAFLIVYDEGEETGSAFYGGYAVNGYVNTWCKNVTKQPLSVCGGQVYAVAVSPYSHQLQYTSSASDYNLESTVEWLFGLGKDGGWDGTSAFPAMTGLFSFAQNGVRGADLPAGPPGGAAGPLDGAWLPSGPTTLGAVLAAAVGLAIAKFRGWGTGRLPRPLGGRRRPSRPGGVNRREE